MLYIPANQPVITAMLDWKESAKTEAFPVGKYRIDLPALEAKGYVRLQRQPVFSEVPTDKGKDRDRDQPEEQGIGFRKYPQAMNPEQTNIIVGPNGTGFGFFQGCSKVTPLSRA